MLLCPFAALPRVAHRYTTVFYYAYVDGCRAYMQPYQIYI